MSRVGVLVLCLSLGVGSFASAGDMGDSSLEQVLIESASTPKDYMALADYFKGEAAAARKDAEYHRSMGEAYGGAKITDIAAMKGHCEKLAALDESAAQEYDKLAEAYAGMGAMGKM